MMYIRIDGEKEICEIEIDGEIKGVYNLVGSSTSNNELGDILGGNNQ